MYLGIGFSNVFVNAWYFLFLKLKSTTVCLVKKVYSHRTMYKIKFEI